MPKFYFLLLSVFLFSVKTNAQCLKGDCKNGYGEFQKEGIIYLGNFTNGFYDGKGELKAKDNSESYIGNFRNNKFHGKGRYNLSNGDVYDGDWVDGKRTGKCVYVFGEQSDFYGERYEGEVLNGKWHGKGKFFYASGDVYDGDWVNGQKTGSCNYTFADGRKYSGEVLNGKWNGKGKYYYSNGDIYDGDWVNGKQTGSCIHTFADGRKYIGEVLDAKWNGQGVFYYTNGSSYNGAWKNSFQTGQGIFTWPGGNKFEGTFENDNIKKGKFFRHGELIFEGLNYSTNFTGGEQWIFRSTGSFVQLLDQKLQIASIRYDNGDYFIGKVYNDYLGVLDKPNGEGIMVYAEGKAVSGTFSSRVETTKINAELEFSPSKAELWYRYGTALKAYGGWALAELEYKRALNLEPNNQTYQFALLEALMKQAKYDDANKIIETILSKDSKNAYAINNKAIIFYDQKEYVNAISQFDILIKSDSKNYNYIYSRGLCHFNLKNYKKAINDFTAAIKIEETSNAYFYRGQSFLENNQKTEACEDFQKAKQMGQKAIDTSISAACN